MAEELSGHKNPITLTRHILAEQTKHKESQGDLTILLQSVQLAVKVIANAFSKAGIANMYGVAGEQNASGDQQKKLDVFSDEAFINCMTFSEKIAVMVSEEQKEPVIVDQSRRGKYAIVFDPLDGSSNIDANVAVGTIFGIFKKTDEHTAGTLADVLRPGRELTAAGYAIYGPSTMLVLTTGGPVNGFTLDPSLGEFILTHKDIQIPKRGKIYSINEGNSTKWDAATRAYVEHCKNPQDGSKACSARYIGSMVADVHRTLMYGGIFAYPGDQSSPNGKLRTLYECGPMGFIVDRAGGYSSTGRGSILDVVPSDIHGRSPIWLGSIDDVREVEEFYRRMDAK